MLPARHYGSVDVFLEAMASELPIVGHDSPRLRWIVGDNEFLVDTEDPAAVVSAITAAANDGSQGVGRSIRAAQFSWSKVADSYHAFLEEIVGKSNT